VLISANRNTDDATRKGLAIGVLALRTGVAAGPTLVRAHLSRFSPIRDVGGQIGGAVLRGGEERQAKGCVEQGSRGGEHEGRGANKLGCERLCGGGLGASMHLCYF
jgi:hypothetical protein